MFFLCLRNFFLLKMNTNYPSRNVRDYSESLICDDHYGYIVSRSLPQKKYWFCVITILHSFLLIPK